MSSLFLTEYIKSNMFIQELHKEIIDRDINFDLIISDIDYDNCPILSITPKNKPENVSLIDARKDAILVSKHPLIILNEINLYFLKPILELLDRKDYVTIINIHTWLWSYGKKLITETNDLDLINDLEFNKYEPIDLENMWNIFKQNEKQYIRLLHKEMPDAIFNVDELGIIDASMLKNLDSISLKTYWFAWNDWVILTTWSLFATAIQTWELIQNHNKQISIFILQKLNSKRTEEMINNIKNSKKLFIIIDHNNSDALKNKIEKTLKKQNLNDIQLNIIYPKYDNLTTIFNEYQEEQSNFNPEKLSERIISKL